MDCLVITPIELDGLERVNLTFLENVDILMKRNTTSAADYPGKVFVSLWIVPDIG